MKSSRIVIPNKLGLHARAAAKLVSTASSFSSQIYLERNGNRINGKSIMGVMMLAASQGSEVTVMVEGDDEEQALAALLKLIHDGFGEEQ
jgi:phosphocarrier protein